MIITISGKPGSGRTSIAQLLAHQLKAKVLRAGKIREQIAEEKGLGIDELNELDEIKPESDERVDATLRHLAQGEENLIVVSLLGWKFLPDSFRIFLDVSERVGAHRVFRTMPYAFANEDDVRQLHTQRLSSDRRRFATVYQVDHLNKNHYDLWIDTSMLTQKEVVDMILNSVNKEDTVSAAVRKQSEAF
ncbi:hypothetical protein CMO91_05700 [Candidatus Woesearchaeota archaeon]|nr:hypothetical protein [Candidatus Woesearchaeota archaeon]|tara:strand:+ start:83 stop:652 length:570 start_codon:yes stop_codon:yes gene_type:complete